MLAVRALNEAHHLDPLRKSRRNHYVRIISARAFLRNQTQSGLLVRPWQPKTDERVKPAPEACARVTSTLYACPVLAGRSPWMILPALRVSLSGDRCAHPADASLFQIPSLAHSLFAILPFAH